MALFTKLLAASLFCLLVGRAAAYEVLALGTSNTNCKGVERAKSFTVHLQELLRADGYDAIVVNAGEDGDKPFWMINRMSRYINAETRLVIFEPGPNDRNPSSNIGYSEKILAELQARKLPVIYVSNLLIQNLEEARLTAAKFGADYYGPWTLGVPVDSVHRQYDMPGSPGHMTGAGCQFWARNILPLVEKVLTEKYGKMP